MTLLSFLATETGEALHLLIGLKERESEFKFSLISPSNSCLRGDDQRAT